MRQLDRNFIVGQPRIESLRQKFGDALFDLAVQRDDVAVLFADLASAVGLQNAKERLRRLAGDNSEEFERFGHKFVEVGVAEQNLVGVASGLAHMGQTPFAISYAAFNPGRNWEQIRTTICLNNQPVKIVGTHAGLNVGPDGASHQMLEDIALMQVLPNMVVLAPGDAIEAAQMVQLMADDPRPNYIRLPRADLPIFSTPDDQLEIGKAYLLRQDDDAVVTIISTGSMTGNALLASGELFKRGIASEVVHVPTIKPLDRETILSSCGRTSVTVVIEEHQVVGGLGASVASLIMVSDVRPVKFKQIGITDQFGQSGTLAELWQHYGLDLQSIVKTITSLLVSD